MRLRTPSTRLSTLIATASPALVFVALQASYVSAADLQFNRVLDRAISIDVNRDGIPDGAAPALERTPLPGGAPRALASDMPPIDRLFAVSFQGIIYEVDPESGTPREVGSTGLTGTNALTGLAGPFVDSEAGKPGVGDGTLHIPLGNPTSAVHAPFLPGLDVRGLARLDSTRIFAVHNRFSSGGGSFVMEDDELYRIDLPSGVATSIGVMDDELIQGLALSPNGELWALSLRLGIVRVDPATAALTDPYPETSFGAHVQGIAFTSEGAMYGASEWLYRVDFATGQARPVGQESDPPRWDLDVRGIFFIAPTAVDFAVSPPRPNPSIGPQTRWIRCVVYGSSELDVRAVDLSTLRVQRRLDVSTIQIRDVGCRPQSCDGQFLPQPDGFEDLVFNVDVQQLLTLVGPPTGPTFKLEISADFGPASSLIGVDKVHWRGHEDDSERERPLGPRAPHLAIESLSPGTRLQLRLAEAGWVTIEVFDLRGRRVRNLGFKQFRVGTYQLDWDALDDRGHPVGRGVYLIRARTPSGLAHGRTVILR